MNDMYVDTVRLMLGIAPIIFDTPLFAMKGGTALNLFVQAMPRLSVDIDVVVVDRHLARGDAIAAISNELDRARAQIEAEGHAVSTATASGKAKGDEVKLTVISGQTSVKVEVNYVFRGTLLEPVSRPLVKAAEEMFSTSITVPTLHEAELYGSKLVAALDRQHPRDLYDVLHMYSAPSLGLRSDILDAFVCYLAGHNRPIHEVLFAPKHPMADAHEKEFVGLTIEAVDVKTLEATQDQLHRELPAALTAEHREFLLSLVRLEPNWALMPYGHLSELPAIKWKVQNLEKLKKKSAERFAEQEALLRQKFDEIDAGAKPQ
ncbi:nucleotidyl transferase AbiEii/AbiGii toxin family protein (plasmid) [Burkholderia vietnamiensis]|uniref:Nucleotidyl transferase AbiEii toxin, Type IV TA system n=1 Tax=Burkholderia vietnamiensis (strain G4 / LMG 22486) TaxID=269482 RepID=A4JU43_BURVG|nr:conserved hypothetical protein [Burkholderia vietnamiensis G4]MCB4350042.1 nucleotidyl transferase AbiEii/AbiGii toxin family protein [Burkholderia vietnamiensis]